jgi:collagenase-like PrtC family protease
MFNNEKCFCIPLAGEMNYVKEIVKKFSNKIYEFYGSNGEIISAVKCRKLSKKQLTDIIKFLNDNNIKFNFTLNSIVSEYYLDNREYILDFLQNIKTEYVTIAEPLFGFYIKQNTNLKVCNSILTNIDNEIKIKRLIEYGFDRIIISEDCIKKIPLLKYLRTIIPNKINMEILVNGYCKLGCINKNAHYNPILKNLLKEFKIINNNLNIKCNMSFKDFLMSSWIRSKDVDKYKDIGINLFKIAGRYWDEDLMINFVNNFLTNNVKEYNNINEDKYDEFFNFLFNEGCKERCLECNKCTYFVNKIIR